MSEFPTQSTYVAPFTITDRDGLKLGLKNADITYAIAENRGSGETLIEYTDADPEVEVQPDGETGLVEVTVGAEDITFTGTVQEELRVERTEGNVAVSQRRVTFSQTVTNA